MCAVSICDVGPRDGLQNEARTLEPEVRASLCDRLAAAGLKKMEAASFVNPKLVPQMAGAEEVMSAIHRAAGVVYAGLVLNEKGYERAAAAGVYEIHYAFSATDEFGRRNQNATSAQGLETALSLVRRARADQMPITVTISVAFGCPFEGPVPPKRVLELVEQLMQVRAEGHRQHRHRGPGVFAAWHGRRHGHRPRRAHRVLALARRAVG